MDNLCSKLICILYIVYLGSFASKEKKSILDIYWLFGVIFSDKFNA